MAPFERRIDEVAYMNIHAEHCLAKSKKKLNKSACSVAVAAIRTAQFRGSAISSPPARQGRRARPGFKRAAAIGRCRFDRLP
jgi:hypothetical protein